MALAATALGLPRSKFTTIPITISHTGALEKDSVTAIKQYLSPPEEAMLRLQRQLKSEVPTGIIHA